MNSIINTNFSQYIIKVGHVGLVGENKQILFRFPNGYGASVIKGSDTYGNAELAVVKFHGTGTDDFKLVYDTPIANDVIGMEDVNELFDLLTRIMALEAK